jgi:hypothetical protein
MIGYSQRVLKANRDADQNNLGVRLGKFCIAKDIPVTDVMSFFDVTKQTVYNWFYGISAPSKQHSKKINDFFQALG